MSERSISRIIDSIETVEGGGFRVRRPFPTRELEQIDPFLLLDEMGPADLAPGEARGAPDHPHRGFETVTYLLQGGMAHRDSAGNAGLLGPGDVQWMTAGDGVVHSEMPTEELLRAGGRMHGFQAWVNLPRRDKRIKPRYQEIPASKIPSARNGDGSVHVKVIAGDALGVHAAVETRTPIFYLHFTMKSGAAIVQRAPSAYNAFAYLISGRARFGSNNGKTGDRGQAVIFASDGDEVSIHALDAVQLLLLGGIPLREPVARYGPFVMNTREELMEAFDDYQSGRLGRSESSGAA